MQWGPRVLLQTSKSSTEQRSGLVKKKKKYYLAELAASWTTGGTLVGMAGEKGQRQRV